MRVYYAPDGKIAIVVREKDEFWKEITIGPGYSTLEIDELDPENKAICRDLEYVMGRIDIDGDGKYYVETGELYEKDDWEEYQVPIIP